MKRFLAALVYTGLIALANPSAAEMSDIAALREGDMKKLVLHDTPKDIPDLEILDETDTPRRLSDHAGKWLVVNFWATWCAPCRKEMPTLSNLQTRMSDQPVEVVTIATGRNPAAAVDRFLEEIGADNLPQYRDPKQALARQIGIMGLPVTLIVDPDQKEIARLIGDAHWDSDSALAILEALAATR